MPEAREAVKPLLNVAIMGHVDNGKSTLVGRLMIGLGRISGREMKNAQTWAKSVGDETCWVAFLLDQHPSERKKRQTQEDKFFEPIETEKNFVKIVDLPGHEDFMANMVRGASLADSAILVVDTYEVLHKVEQMHQLREHATFIFILNLKQPIVVLNKMDKLNYDEDLFRKAKETVAQLLRKVGISEPEKYQYVPASAYEDENIVRKSEKMPWYDGPTFLEALATLAAPPRATDRPLRLPIFRHFDRGGIAVGVVKSGTLRAKDRVVLRPIDLIGTVSSIETWNRRIEVAYPGDDVGISISGIGSQYIKPGYVIGHLKDPPTVARRFKARVYVFGSRGLRVGYSPTLNSNTLQVACRITSFEARYGPDGKKIQENPTSLQPGQFGDIWIEPLCAPLKGIPIETEDDFPDLARIALRDQDMTIAAGKCVQVEPVPLEWPG